MKLVLILLVPAAWIGALLWRDHRAERNKYRNCPQPSNEWRSNGGRK